MTAMDSSASPSEPTTTPTEHIMNNPTAPQPSHDPEVTTPTRHPARVGTIVWGAVVLVIGLLVILSSQLNLDLDAGQTAMWLLLGAGVAMVAGGAVKLLSKKRP
ncbi:hypothetical protein MB46_13560 [Arthrobacter alpinus]|nr:hypothetical protein MB46_13560 [Arthrobacter alpinus]